MARAVPLSPQGAGGVLTDFASFYTLPSTVMHHPLHRSLKAAYSFYNVHTQTPLLDLMNDALILAKLVIASRWGGALTVVRVCYFTYSYVFFNRKASMSSMPWILWRIKCSWRSSSLV